MAVKIGSLDHYYIESLLFHLLKVKKMAEGLP
jgi:hypothetical protein